MNGGVLMAEQRMGTGRVQLRRGLAIVFATATVLVPVDPADARTRRARMPSFAAPLPEPRPIEPAPTQPASEPASPPAAEAPAAQEAEPDCGARLAAMGVVFSRPNRPVSADARCAIEDAVQLDHLRDGNAVLRWPDRPVLACTAAERFAGFSRDAIKPMARAMLGGDLVALGTGNGFDCRPRNRQAGARLSAHGQGLAVDIAWFELEGRRRISVETPGSDAERRFLGAVRRAACGWFTTVLGPGSDAAHANHFHLDAERRGRDGQSRLCQ